ncbi:hypothetical protein MmiHf6_11900 [Methanimicrococcus hongohii]|uniref:Uncharacterized protein n=1 Tax=Methanimicrococcus hongohii TaxID=3028295 RepID=A0AA96VBH2_9EURY|nr:hypothetical protein [Methanimicrococcus sp. Hf6]WNY23867.1 hypothetical protein MmiHf6_11900 [Methanimicrococcus sp. Hf6]
MKTGKRKKATHEQSHAPPSLRGWFIGFGLFRSFVFDWFWFVFDWLQGWGLLFHQFMFSGDKLNSFLGYAFSIEIKQGLDSGLRQTFELTKTAETGIKQYRSISHDNRFAWLVFYLFSLIGRREAANQF